MSNNRGKSKNGGVGIGIESIPAGSRKMVQSLKEIVNNNWPDSEIYAILKDCNMDPNEAVNKLLSQDPFHEVKSKREKRKESLVQNKDTTESRSWVTSSIPNRGSRAGAERYVGRSGSESTKPAAAYRKEGGSHTSNMYSTSGAAGSNTDRKPNPIIDAVGNENKRWAPPVVDGHSATSQPSSGYQATWGGGAQVSMADIVKMGRPQSKVPNVSQQTMQFPDNDWEVHEEPGDYSSQQLSANDEWPSVERPSVEQPAVSEYPTQHPDPPNMSFDRVDSQPEADEAQAEDDPGAAEDLSTSLSGKKLPEDNVGSASLYDNDIYTYQHENLTFNHQQVEDVNVSVSSLGANFQELSVKDDRNWPADGDGPSVVIPNHLQVQTADCSHLSFGSFGRGSLSGSLAPAPAQASSDDAPRSEYYGNETFKNEPDSNLFHRSNANSGDYDLPSASLPEPMKAETSGQGHQYSFPSSGAAYPYENAQQLNAAFNQIQTSSEMQNHAPFSTVTVYTNSLQSANVLPGQESYSPFRTTQTMPTKYSNSVSSISGSTISVPETLKTVGLASQQQMLSGSGVPPQHLTVHQYSQPTLPLGAPYANMMGYPYMHQNYPYMLQQAFPGNTTYHHQSLSAMLPQYKNSVSGSGSSATIPTGYTTIPPAAAASATNLTYDDVLSSQYKDVNHLMSLQQSENSALWLHGGPASRTMSAAGPANTYYGFQGQSQQTGGFRQAQQQQQQQPPSQSYGSYPHYYNSQALDQHQQLQNLRDGSSKQSQQMWQNNSY